MAYYSAIKKEWNSNTCYNMNELWNIKLRESGQTSTALHDSTYMNDLE